MKHVGQLAGHDSIWDTIRRGGRGAHSRQSLMQACLINPISRMPSATFLPSGSAANGLASEIGNRMRSPAVRIFACTITTSTLARALRRGHEPESVAFLRTEARICSSNAASNAWRLR
jgi:hypothetical protein